MTVPGDHVEIQDAALRINADLILIVPWVVKKKMNSKNVLKHVLMITHRLAGEIQHVVRKGVPTNRGKVTG